MSSTPVPSPLQTSPSTFIDRFRAFAAEIKISHTIFAMPWAVLSTFLAAKVAFGTLPHLGQLALIVICMITARTVAMGANRLLDADLDAKNPRTARRALPSGRLSRSFFITTSVACVWLFVTSAAGFGVLYQNWLPLVFSIPVLAFICAYPLLKRFSALCHFYLGLALGLAPICAWIAIAGTLSSTPVMMGLAVLLWTGGFDIIYACQDYESDVREGVFSVPAKVGIAKALWISRGVHLVSAALIVYLGLVTPPLGMLYMIGAAAAILLLVVEHSLVRANDLSKVSLAFFTLNGLISLTLGILGVIDVVL